jgi:hypothetical protein
VPAVRQALVVIFGRECAARAGERNGGKPVKTRISGGEERALPGFEKMGKKL